MKESRTFGLSFGDLGVIAIALIFALGSLYLMVGPSIFGDYFQRVEAAKHEHPQTGEVTVGILPDKPATPH